MSRNPNSGSFQNGHTAWNRGRRGLQKHSLTTREKLSKIRFGTRATEATKKKMSESQMGHKGYWMGKKLSEKHKERLRGHIPWNKGKKFLQIIGEKNPNWKGGITPENHKIKHSIEYHLWHESVLIRDNFTCQKCNQRGGKLCSHHIQSFAKFSELRVAIDNGITFCRECHKEFHNIYGRTNNDLKQIEEFLKSTKL